MNWRTAFGVAAIAILPTGLSAGAFSDFETDLREAYGHYRTALFQSNAGKAEPTQAAIEALSGAWAALEADWAAEPPPQYADDPGFGTTLDSVAAIVDEAAGEAAAGQLAEAHETLEGVREEIGALHMRNGIVRFSDRMNAYHAVMEEVLTAGVPADGSLGQLREEAAVLMYLARDIVAHPAPEAADPAYAPMVDDLLASVAALQEAARAGDAAAAKAALGALKMPYAKLFARFG